MKELNINYGIYKDLTIGQMQKGSFYTENSFKGHIYIIFFSSTF